MKALIVVLLTLLAGCATTSQQVQEAFDECLARTRDNARCLREADARREALDGKPAESDGVHNLGSDTPTQEDQSLPPECRDNWRRALARAGDAWRQPTESGMTEGDKQWQACENAKNRAAVERAGERRSGCQADAECKGDRICEDGRCVRPRQ